MAIYREKLHPSPWFFIILLLIIPSILILLLAIGQGWLGLIIGIGSYLLIAFAFWYNAAQIEVTETELKVGNAWIEKKFISSVTSYEGDDAFRQRGPLCNPKAWLKLQGGIDPVVKIEISDPEDQTPYWLISTRNPAGLITALGEGNQPS